MSKIWHKAKVVRGEGRGKGLGYPTANLQRPANFNQKYGIYSVHICFALPSAKGLPAGKTGVLKGILYWGTRGGGKPSLEIHIFDFDPPAQTGGDLYGQELQFQVGDFIREDRKFDSIAELVKQIHLDVAKARAIIN